MLRPLEKCQEEIKMNKIVFPHELKIAEIKRFEKKVIKSPLNVFLSAIKQNQLENIKIAEEKVS